MRETKSAEYRLTQLARRLTTEGHCILILVDGLQVNSPEVRRLIAVYQELVGERLNVAIALAGLPAAVSATLNGHALTFLNRACRITLSPLATEDVEPHFRQSFRSLEVRLPAPLCRRVAEFTQGSPYLLQLVGHNVVLAADDAGEVSDATLERAISQAAETFETDVCETTLSAVSEKGLEFLAAMQKDHPRSRVSDNAERMSVTVDYAQKYRKCLIDAGIIEPAGRGFIRFAVPYLQDYLREVAQRQWAICPPPVQAARCLLKKIGGGVSACYLWHHCYCVCVALLFARRSAQQYGNVYMPSAHVSRAHISLRASNRRRARVAPSLGA